MNYSDQSIFGIRIKSVTKSALLNAIQNAIQNDSKILILSGNVHSFNLAYDIPWMKDMFNNANFIRIDGAGLQLGAKILGFNIQERMTWADFAWELGKFCQEKSYSLFLLGGRPGIADKAAMRLIKAFPDLQITGVHHGYFDKTTVSLENNQVLREINIRKPNLLIIGFGMPTQERWLLENWDTIDTNVALTGGAVFDYISGELRRPPHWMTDHGLEWLGRFIIEPRRLWRRYILGNMLFLFRLFKQILTNQQQ